MMKNNSRIAASFRDPSGFLFSRDSVLFRQVNQSYQADYDQLMDSGLYERLRKKGFLVPHEEVEREPLTSDSSYKVIQPKRLPFISYPYEWSFSQLKSAALLTLKIQKYALEFGMSLKDSSAYNIQFRLKNSKPILIDTLSFETYKEGTPWVAYKQYCQHFLAPLALMALTDVRLSQLMRSYIDGVPLDLASKLLPRRSKLNFGLMSHIHLHASAQKRYADQDVGKLGDSRKMSKTNLLGFIDSLERTTKSLSWKPGGTEWGEYYDDTNYSDTAFQNKSNQIKEFIKEIKPTQVWDLGANTGIFSRIASEMGIDTVAFDIDPTAVEKNYRDVRLKKEKHLLPLVLDLTNPSPNIGWNNDERLDVGQRGKPDLILALALIHHLSISNNVPLEMVAEYFNELAPWLIIEFVPKSDSQVKRLLSTREDIFPNYSFEGFETAFEQFYEINKISKVEKSERKLYLMKRK